MEDMQLIVQSITSVTHTPCASLELHDLFHIIKRYLLFEAVWSHELSIS